MRILYFPCTHSAAGFYRCFQPALELERQFGHETYVTHWDTFGPINRHYLDENDLMDADVIVLQMRPEKIWLKLIPVLQQRGKKIVCEADDWYGGLPPWHPARKALASAGLSTATIHQIYSLADAMTVSTPFLQRDCAKYNDNVHLLPNYLDWEMWKRKPKRDWGRLRIGWMGNAALRPDDISVLKGVIGPFLRRHPEVDFVAAGSPQIHEELDVPEGQRVSYPMVEYPQLPEIMKFDIGLVPLALHNFNQAKSHLKGLEYAACGIPCIASPTEPYQSWAESNAGCLLARRPADWLRHLERLVSDNEGRRSLGARARRVARGQAIANHAHLWNDLYSELAGDTYDGLARQAVKRQALQKPTELAGFLRFVSERPAPRTVVEIGTAQGGTLGALCQIAADDALVVSIDLPGGDKDEVSADDKYGSRDTDLMASYRKPGQRLEFLQVDSQRRSTRAVLENILLGRRIDLLFIDGDHSYAGVRRDFELYLPLLAEDGVVAFHDVLTHAHEGTEVDRFWAELKRDYKTRTFATHGEDWGWGEWGGIGVIDMTEQRERIAA